MLTRFAACSVFRALYFCAGMNFFQRAEIKVELIDYLIATYRNHLKKLESNDSSYRDVQAFSNQDSHSQPSVKQGCEQSTKREAGMRTRSILNRVQEILASSNSSSAKNDRVPASSSSSLSSLIAFS